MPFAFGLPGGVPIKTVPTGIFYDPCRHFFSVMPHTGRVLTELPFWQKRLRLLRFFRFFRLFRLFRLARFFQLAADGKQKSCMLLKRAADTLRRELPQRHFRGLQSPAARFFAATFRPPPTGKKRKADMRRPLPESLSSSRALCFSLRFFSRCAQYIISTKRKQRLLAITVYNSL